MARPTYTYTHTYTYTYTDTVVRVSTTRPDAHELAISEARPFV